MRCVGGLRSGVQLELSFRDGLCRRLLPASLPPSQKESTLASTIEKKLHGQPAREGTVYVHVSDIDIHTEVFHQCSNYWELQKSDVYLAANVIS